MIDDYIEKTGPLGINTKKVFAIYESLEELLTDTIHDFHERLKSYPMNESYHLIRDVNALTDAIGNLQKYLDGGQ